MTLVTFEEEVAMENVEAQVLATTAAGGGGGGEVGDASGGDADDGDASAGNARAEAAGEPRMDAEEHLATKLARLRARFGIDPWMCGATLEDAWASPTAPTEEDEAEFIDALADCLGVGLSLAAALDCWDAGGLVDRAAQDDDDDDDDDDYEEDDDSARDAVIFAPAASHARPGARRVLVG